MMLRVSSSGLIPKYLVRQKNTHKSRNRNEKRSGKNEMNTKNFFKCARKNNDLRKNVVATHEGTSADARAREVFRRTFNSAVIFPLVD